MSFLAMSVPDTWSRVVLSRVVSPHNFDGLAMSFLAFSASPTEVTQCWPITDPESTIKSLDANDTEVPGWPECSLHAAAGGTTALL